MIDSLDVVRQKLGALAATNTSDGHILSVAVTTSRLDDWRQTVPVFLNSGFSQAVKESGIAADGERRLQAGLERILDLLKYELSPAVQGLVAFSDGTDTVGEQVELPLRLENHLTVEPWPYVRPLAEAISLLEPFVLAQVSRDDSSLYVVDEWGATKEGDLAGPWLRSSDRETGELSIKKYYAAARRDGLVEQHHKEVSASLGRLLEVSGIKRVVLCAQHEIAAAFRRTLPTPVAGAVVAEIPLDAVASMGKMVASAREAADGARQERLAGLAGRIEEGLGPGGHGAAGFEDVGGAVAAGQVHTLLVDREYRVPGWSCRDCHWVGLVATDACPLCGLDLFHTADAVGELVRLTILEQGQIEVAEDLKKLRDLGGVAVLLRYA